MKIGDKVTYDFYGRNIITKIKEIDGDQVLVVGLASWNPIEMFKPYDDKGNVEGEAPEGAGEIKISDQYGADSDTHQERID